MATSLYIASLEPASGKSLVALGLMELLCRRLDGVGYFRPVVPASPDPDPRVALIRSRYDVSIKADEQSVYTSAEVADLLAQGNADEVFKTVLARFRDLEEHCEFVLCDGTDYSGVVTPQEFEFNARLASHLGTPVLTLVTGRGHTADEIVDAVGVARESLTTEGCAVAATVVNRVDPEDLDEIRQALANELSEREPIWLIPEEPFLGMPTMREIADAIGAHDIRTEGANLDAEVRAYKIAAMSLPNMLDHVVEGAVVLAPGDRADVVVGSLVSRLSTTYPNIAGLILTGGLTPPPQVTKLLDGLEDIPVPIVAAESDTYATAEAVAGVDGAITPGSEAKIATALGLFEEHVDIADLEERIEVVRSDRVTPLMFEYDLIERARADRRHIVLPEAEDERILRAASILLRRRVVDVTLLGDEADVADRAASLGLDLDGAAIVDPASSDLRHDFAATYRELRSHKGVTEDAAREVMLDVSYFGTMMVREGRADGMVSGAAHTTQHTIRPAFEVIRTDEGVSVVSSVFLMLLADRVLVYGDCAVNPNPEADELADIAISSSQTAELFGIDPRVAMLSYSTGESGKGADVERIREATALVRERRPDLQVAGPIQYDAAVDASVAQQKLPDSDVAGRATVFIFPDLNTGNNTYKAVQRSAGAVAIGPVLQGLRRPVNDLSRGCTVTDVVNTVAITAVQAQAGGS